MVFSKGVRAPVCAHGTQYFLIIYKEKSAPAMTHQWHWADQYVMLIHPTRLLGRGRWFGDRWQVRNAASAKWGHLPCLGNGNEQSGRCWRRFGECQVSIAQNPGNLYDALHNGFPWFTKPTPCASNGISGDEAAVAVTLRQGRWDHTSVQTSPDPLEPWARRPKNRAKCTSNRLCGGS